MTQFSSFTRSWQTMHWAAVAGVVFAVSLACVSAADAKPEKETADQKKAASKPEKKTQYTGADLYAMHCNRCHPERYATERTANQWKTILVHMRVRANLPAEQAKAILKFLQEDSGK